jgi:hypothetical protein
VPRYNIALLPIDAAARCAFVVLARANFAAVHDGYLLGPAALPHITLCQFEAEDEEAAVGGFRSWRDKGDLRLQIREFRLRPGVSAQFGWLWAEFVVEHRPALFLQQKSCVEHLKAAGFAVLTQVATYNPHLTLARLAEGAREVPPPNPPYRHRLGFRPALGPSTENGVFVRELTWG